MISLGVLHKSKNKLVEQNRLLCEQFQHLVRLFLSFEDRAILVMYYIYFVQQSCVLDDRGSTNQTGVISIDKVSSLLYLSW